MTTPWKICLQNSENFSLEFRKGWETCAFSKQINFSQKCLSEHAQWNFGKPAVTLLTKNEKLSRTPKMLKLHFFEQIYFSHQKWFFSNGQCNLDNGSKYFSLRVQTFAAQIPKTTKKNFELLERKITFLKIFLCTCRMQLWQPCQKIPLKTLKTFCSNSGNAEKKNFPKNLFLFKMFVWTCTKKFWQDWRNFVSKNTKEFSIVQIRWSYNFFIRNCFHQKWFSSNGDCNFDNPTKKFSTKSHRFVTQIPKGRENLWIFRKENYFSSNCASAHV